MAELFWAGLLFAGLFWMGLFQNPASERGVTGQTSEQTTESSDGRGQLRGRGGIRRKRQTSRTADPTDKEFRVNAEFVEALMSLDETTRKQIGHR